MKWRALAVAVAGVSVALASCSFEPEWRQYCNHPGRCSEFDGGISPSTLIAQSSINRRIVLAGDYLAGATSVSVVPDTAGTATIASSADHEVEVDVTVNPGVQVGSPLTLRVLWDQERPDEFQDSAPLEVTAITVASGGNDTTGFGTPDAPYGSLHHAGQVSGAGDTIHLGAGRFPGIYDAGTACDHPSGLKPGVSVEGESMDASVVLGDGTADSCAFKLSTAGQIVHGVTLTGFTEGIRVTSAGGARPTIADVTVSSCDAGVVGRQGSAFDALRTDLLKNGAGLVCDSCDAVVQGEVVQTVSRGTIGGSARNGVLVGGVGSRLVLTGGFVQDNASITGDDLAGAGVLIASTNGTATIGDTVSGSGTTGVTVAGRSNLVTFDGAILQASQGAYSLLLKATSDAGVFLKNTRINSCGVGVKVEGAAFLNGGTADGGNGGNTFSCSDRDPSTTELWDARPPSPLSPLVFSRSSFHGNGVPPPGTDITRGSFDAGWWGILVDDAANHVKFE